MRESNKPNTMASLETLAFEERLETVEEVRDLLDRLFDLTEAEDQQHHLVCMVDCLTDYLESLHLGEDR